MSDIPKEFTSEYYDHLYFSDKVGKAFKRPDGSIDHWGYRNPDGEWLGCRPIVQAWKIIFNPETMLDIGCGQGTFVAYARDVGIEAYGVDFSEYAIKNHYPRVKPEWIWVGDALNFGDYQMSHSAFLGNKLIGEIIDRYDLVTCLDLMEHVYEEDVDKVVNNLFSHARKHIFLQIAVCGAKDKPEKPYSLKRGESVPIELEGNAVAGHVFVQRSGWWVDKFSQNDDWQVRWDYVNWFKALVPSEVIANWLQNLILVVSKVEE